MKIIEAAKKGDIAEVEMCLSQGSDVAEVDKDGRSVLHWAAIGGHNDLLKWLVREKGLSIDMKDNKGCTAFFESCYGQHWGTASICLDMGADPNCYSEGTAPILMAAGYLQADLITKMLSIKTEYGEQKLDLTVRLNDGGNALHMAASAETPHAQKNLTLAKLLYDSGTPNCEDSFGHTPAEYLGEHDISFQLSFEKYTHDHSHDAVFG